MRKAPPPWQNFKELCAELDEHSSNHPGTQLPWSDYNPELIQPSIAYPLAFDSHSQFIAIAIGGIIRLYHVESKSLHQEIRIRYPKSTWGDSCWPPSLQHCSFSPDGHYLFVWLETLDYCEEFPWFDVYELTTGSLIMRIDPLQEGIIRDLYPMHPGIGWSTVSPDGAYLIYEVNTGNPTDEIRLQIRTRSIPSGINGATLALPPEIQRPVFTLNNKNNLLIICATLNNKIVLSAIPINPSDNSTQGFTARWVPLDIPNVEVAIPPTLWPSNATCSLRVSANDHDVTIVLGQLGKTGGCYGRFSFEKLADPATTSLLMIPFQNPTHRHVLPELSHSGNVFTTHWAVSKLGATPPAFFWLDLETNQETRLQITHKRIADQMTHAVVICPNHQYVAWAANSKLFLASFDSLTHL